MFITLLGETNIERNISNILNSPNYSIEFKKNYLRGYMQPFASAFGITTSGAMYHRATIKEFPRFDIGISAVYLTVLSDDLWFNDPQNNKVPTVFGSTNVPSFDNTLPGGIGDNSILVPQFQINMGLVSSFEATARYMRISDKNFGDMSFIGLGVKYGFGEFIPLFPVELSVQAMYHKFSIDDWLDSGTIGMNLQISKSINILPFDVYGGIGFENTLMLIKTESIKGGNILNIEDISIDGKNKYRINLGLSWTLAFINIHVDYNLGYYNSLSFGSMIVL